jgi:outer membrane protein OmpA-like peptidoglycan-associated protein
MKYIKFILLPPFFWSTFAFNQLVDFENLPNSLPGVVVGELTAPNSTCSIEFFCGKDLETTSPLTLQKVGYQNNRGGFYGIEYSKDCDGKQVPTGWSNQVNNSPYVQNPSISNRERIGCYFISTILIGEEMPSIFILYKTGTKSCSADLIDVDGHDNTIEAYDIYYYAEKEDFPANPINENPVEIRSIGKTIGDGVLGDNGGVLPFKIESTETFKLIEIRPIQKVNPKNKKRLEFGFALDNFSPCSIEKIIPEVIVEQEQIMVEPLKSVTEKPVPEIISAPELLKIDPVYFDFDSDELTPQAKSTLNELIAANRKNKIKLVYLEGYTDPKGTDEYNLDLSKRRLEAVKNYLLMNGFTVSQLTTSFFGEKYDGNLTDEDWKKRKVQIRIN